MQDMDSDIDSQIKKSNNVTRNWQYYTDDQFNHTLNLKHGVSSIDFNSRSLYANFLKYKILSRSIHLTL